jgi:hypothetical protein
MTADGAYKKKKQLPTLSGSCFFFNVYNKIHTTSAIIAYTERIDIMARKIKINDNTYECPACDYRWSKIMGMADLSFDEDEHCPCCPDCSELIEDGDDYE